MRSMARGYEWEMNKCYGCDLCDDACPVRLFNAMHSFTAGVKRSTLSAKVIRLSAVYCAIALLAESNVDERTHDTGLLHLSLRLFSRAVERCKVARGVERQRLWLQLLQLQLESDQYLPLRPVVSILVRQSMTHEALIFLANTEVRSRCLWPGPCLHAPQIGSVGHSLLTVM